MKILCQITGQYYENYGTEINGVSHDAWKPKGSFVFNLKVDVDDFMYAEDECVEAIKMLLEEQSNSHSRFSYVSHELIFNDIIELDSESFQNKLNNLIEKKHTFIKSEN